VTTPAPFGRRGAPARVPTGEVLGSYETYGQAESVVDRLAKADYPVGEVSIIGNDLKSVERVTRKRSWNRAALEGALSGAWFGLFLGLLFTFFPASFTWSLFAAAVLIGAAFGMFFRLVGYAVSRRNRDFDSMTRVVAASYDVLVPGGRLETAQDALARGPQGS